MIALRSVKHWAVFVANSRGDSLATSLKVLTNKSFFALQYSSHRIFQSRPRIAKDWVKQPFSLVGCVKWSPRLSLWYAIEDLSSVISMEGDSSEPQEWLLESLRPGMTLIDVGTHHGRYSITAARLVGP